MAAGIGTGNPILARYFDAVPKVSIFSTTPPAQEMGAKPATFEVFRDAALPFATRVYFNVTGTAKLKTDYTVHYACQASGQQPGYRGRKPPFQAVQPAIKAAGRYDS